MGKRSRRSKDPDDPSKKAGTRGSSKTPPSKKPKLSGTGGSTRKPKPGGRPPSAPQPPADVTLDPVPENWYDPLPANHGKLRYDYI